MIKKTNHICKNPDCKKEYYACDICDKWQGITWRQSCCSKSCFDIYTAICEENNRVAIIENVESVEVATENEPNPEPEVKVIKTKSIKIEE